jgi:hypothetical protein
MGFPVKIKFHSWKTFWLRLFVLAWTFWFSVKILMGRFVYHQDVLGDISHRVSIALKSSSELMITLTSVVRYLCLAIIHWTDVFLPFIQDSWFVARAYVWPFFMQRILSPLGVWLSPVPLFLWHCWTWFNFNVPLEYRFALLCFGLLFFSKRLDPLVKTFLAAFLGIVIAYRWTSSLLGNEYVKIFTFLIVPASLAVHSILRPVPLDRQANLLFYLAISSACVVTEWKLGLLSAPVIHVVTTPASYAFVLAWFHTINAEYLVKNFRIVVNGSGFLPLMKPAAVKVAHALKSKFPILAKAEERCSKFANSFSVNSYALSAITGENRGIVGRVFAFIKSTPFLAVLAIAVVLLLLILYWIHSVASSVFVFALWPWWALDTLKVCMYERKEDYRAQLAFSVLFIALELFLLKQQTGFTKLVLNIFHLPIIIAIKMMPLVVVQLMVKIIGFLPLIIIAPFIRKQKIAASIADEPKPAEPKPVAEEQTKRKSSIVKRRSTNKK